MRYDHKLTTKRKISMLSIILCFSIIFSLVSTLIVQPVVAKTSRIAVIDEVNGTVTVKKAGGSKEFRAYRNMTLNHGDHISTKARSSVVLTIVDREDQVTIGEKSDLYISNLQNQEGNKKTNFSMWGGSMWVKASSLVNSEDEFEIETPTSIMGVRGTNLFAGVDQETGETTYFIASGEGLVKKKNETKQSKEVKLKPLEQIKIDENIPSEELDENKSIVDIDDIVNKIDEAIIEAIIRSKQYMDQENDEYLKKLKQKKQNGPQINETDLDRISQNIDNLVGNIVKTAIEQKKVDEDKINQLINQVNQQTDKKLNLNNVKPLELSEMEKQKQAEMKRLKEQRKQQMEQELQKQEELKKQNEELWKKLQEQKLKQQKANEEAQRKAKERAEKKYLENLSEEQKQRFEKEKRKLQDAEQKKSKKEVKEPAPPPSKSDDPVEVETPNTPPTVVEDVYDLWSHLNETTIVDLSPVFVDDDGDTLTFTASSSNENIATVNMVGSNLQVVPAEEMSGVVEITVTANDGNGGTVNTTFDLFLYPAVTGALIEFTSPNTIDLSFNSEGANAYNIYVNNSTLPALTTKINYEYLSGLEPNTLYDIRIVAVDSNDEILGFSELSATTLPVGTIDNIMATSITDNSITVNWDPFGEYYNYKLYVDGEYIGLSNQQLEYSFTALLPETTYEIKIEAWDSDYMSIWAEKSLEVLTLPNRLFQ